MDCYTGVLVGIEEVMACGCRYRRPVVGDGRTVTFGPPRPWTYCEEAEVRASDHPEDHEVSKFLVFEDQCEGEDLIRLPR
jgi:hypothetical protein